MITSAAIQIIHTGRSHAEILLKIYQEPFLLPTVTVEGFLTDKNIFLSRREAVDHAFECGQIPEKKFELFSYDLEGE